VINARQNGNRCRISVINTTGSLILLQRLEQAYDLIAKIPWLSLYNHGTNCRGQYHDDNWKRTDARNTPDRLA
jgi:hypothetical protein